MNSIISLNMFNIKMSVKMAGNDVLIVSPTNVKFQAPFPHLQKRQLSLLNLGAQPMVYLIDIANEALFQVFPSSGKVAAFDTTELSILMQPAARDQPDCNLTVKYKVKSVPVEPSKEPDPAEDWTHAQTTVVSIALENFVENEKELLNMFGLDGNAKTLIKLMEEQYQPLCSKCSLKRIHRPLKKQSWFSRMSWPLLLVLLSVMVYFGWEWLGLLNLNSETVY
ncbi:uncharacterized protein LOC115763232 [Drosophila novamexicana]|uniref:uncharacterized protein LOC115763232 n=1 Tax=Drosophila novamexicana TaxID=47314 RepID=UPI0011E5DCEF|nr:uncharacterized protein LOC115763232 [Drosophila novamexicana]